MGTEEQLEIAAFRQPGAVSTTEEETSTIQPSYIPRKHTTAKAQTRTAALDAEPATSVASKKPEKVTTKHTRPTSPIPAHSARPSLRGALVCTVGTKLNRSMALPEDGLCDFTFFDSLQKNGLNELSGPFEENFRHFVESAARHTNTEYGAGFDYHAFEEMDEILSDPAAKGHLNSLWDQGIFHFGYLNTPYSDFSHDKFTQLMEILKTVSSLMRDKSTPERLSFTILVAAMHSDLWIKHATHVFRDTFQPDAVVLVGHLSSRRSEAETCEILPPTTLVHFARHASPSLVCRDSAYTVAYHKEEPQGAVAYNRGAGKLLAYDNPESLRRKLCAARSNVTAVKYGFTAFNVEYEDATNRCGEGSFSRLRALKDLLNAFARRDSSEEAEEC
ncbi:uncharacterized protein LOC119431736 [Dermacentor silvarum]|uniref:uncharacterized protein LOC119431736 n=1 Tax=Dermacentor silvarum TaxID=543639 RepID=UPI0021013E49|nr:uncharacterized protein LOC119431736 [Dermacentor silvarum]